MELVHFLILILLSGLISILIYLPLRERHVPPVVRRPAPAPAPPIQVAPREHRKSRVTADVHQWRETAASTPAPGVRHRDWGAERRTRQRADAEDTAPYRPTDFAMDVGSYAASSSSSRGDSGYCGSSYSGSSSSSDSGSSDSGSSSSSDSGSSDSGSCGGSD